MRKTNRLGCWLARVRAAWRDLVWAFTAPDIPTLTEELDKPGVPVKITRQGTIWRR